MKTFRFILNFHSDFDKNRAVNYRVFESLASGSLLFTDENLAQSLLFKDKQHLVCYKDKEDLINKPVEIKEKILDGRVQKILKMQSLLDQPFIKDPNITIDELIKQKISLLGENIKISRFTRFQLGE
jgi:translation elongation factor EF-Ts